MFRASKIKNYAASVKRWVRLNPLKTALLSFGLGFTLMNVIVLVMSAGVFPPNSSINGFSVSGLSAREAIERFDSQLDQNVSLTATDTSVEVSKRELGQQFGQDEFEVFYSNARSGLLPIFWILDRQRTIEPSFNVEQLTLKIADLKKELDVKPLSQNITIDPESGKASLKEGLNGVTVEIDPTVKSILESGVDASEYTMVADVTKKEGILTNAQETIELIDAITQLNISVTNDDGKLVQPSVKDISEWIRVEYNIELASVAFDEEKIRDFIRGQNFAIDSPAKADQVSLLNGQETARIPGVDGISVDAVATAQDVIGALENQRNNAKIRVSINQIRPEPVYDRSYTSNAAGLQARLNYWVESTAGVQGVQVQQLRGGSQSASVNASRGFVAASTYKLYVTSAVFADIEAGKYDLNAKLPSGVTVRSAIEDAIVLSGNDTAIALAEKAGGWASIDSYLASQGYGSTSINNYFANGSFNGDKITTTADLTKLLGRLYKGTFSTQTNNKTLLGFMRAQVFREGVPAGVNGSVANKVGFLENYLNDAALVYGAKADYSLVVLTEDSTWNNIAEVSAIVDSHFGN